MKVLTPVSWIREADRYTIEKTGIPSRVLMEAAGCGTFYALKHRYPSWRSMDLLVGKGNNGGDALVVGRLAIEEGWDVRAYMLTPHLRGDAAFQMERFRRAGGIALPLDAYRPRKAVVVDGLFGTGFRGALPPEIQDVIRRIPEDLPRVAVDIPSGVNGDTGAVEAGAFRASLTVTFQSVKPGHLLFPGRRFTGELVVVPIGLDWSFLERSPHRVVEGEDVRSRLPHRLGPEHKGSVGRVLILSGRKNYAGAVIHAAWGALRAGAGLVFVGVPEAIYPVVAGAVPPAVVFVASPGETLSPEGVARALEYRPDAVVMGPGLGRDPGIGDVVRTLLERFSGPVLVDADAFVVLRDVREEVSSRESLVLTPHPGEMAVWEGRSPADVDRDRVRVAEAWAERNRAVLVLKGAPTLIAANGRVYWNSTGNPGMATGGSGDVLAGVIAALMAQGISPAEAAWMGVWLHGRAGDLMREEVGEWGLTAWDLPEGVARALREMGR